MRCASAGVKRLHVAGSLRLSYIAAENVSYMLRLAANDNRFGCDTTRGIFVGGGLNIVVSAGADELRAGWLNTGLCCFSGMGGVPLRDGADDSTAGSSNGKRGRSEGPELPLEVDIDDPSLECIEPCL